MSCGRSLSRCIIITFNSIFMICGLIVLTASMWIMFSPESFVATITQTSAVDNQGIQKPTDLDQPLIFTFIAIGCFMTLLSFFGCCGALYRQPCLLALYVSMISGILVLEIALGFILIMYQKEADDVVRNWLVYTIKVDYKHSKSNPISLLWDTIFTTYHCCGINDYRDFENSAYFIETKLRFPESCCAKSIGDNGKISNCSRIIGDASFYIMGCFETVAGLLNSYRDILAGIVIGSGALQIILMIAGIILMKVNKIKIVP